MRSGLSLVVALALAGCAQGGGTPAGKALPRHPDNFKTADRIPIVGFLYENTKPKAVILLFHQAGSSKYEYDTIGPRLAEMGYTAFAIDQRSGGDALYGDNSTVHILGGSKPYIDAKQDLQGAVTWAQKKNLPIILWGSSYSAALVFLVAAENPTAIRAVMAFSPGEYLDDPNAVKQAASRLRIPVFVTSAKDPGEIAAARAIVAAVPGTDKQQYVPVTAGTHGSSTLIPAKNSLGAEENWAEVKTFLHHVAP